LLFLWQANVFLTTEEIAMIHNAIRSLPKNIDLSNPTTFIELPFPTPLAPSTSRFHTKRIDGVDCFPYMGRTKFMELNCLVESASFWRKNHGIYLFGTSGSGKSHILAASVVRLIQEGKKVVYLPNCIRLVRNFEATIRIALYFAFYGDSKACADIDHARGVDELLEFLQKNKDNYLVVDELDALESGDDEEAERRMRAWVSKMAADQCCIYSASGNLQSIQDMDTKEVNVTTIQFQGSMDEVRFISSNSSS
jgi:Cdc6-like AAA superfamily ATPase